MVRHILKLIWKRKRSNGFLIAEMLLTFFVLYTVCVLGFHSWNRYTSPNGFTVDKVLNIDGMQPLINRQMEREVVLSQIKRELEVMNEVESVGSTSWSLYYRRRPITGVENNGREIMVYSAYLSDECDDILDMEIIQGRWFGPEDNSGEYRAAVINQKLSREFYGDDNPVGTIFQDRLKIVGVVSDYRLYGPLEESNYLVIERTSVEIPDIPKSPAAPYPGDVLLVKLNAPVSAELNARILTAVQSIAPDWSFDITPAEDLHDACIKQQITPYLIAGVAALSLIAMVILGLFGVLWQNITGRTREIGLRRAKGASIGHIYAQIIGEMLIVTTIGILPGILITGQLVFMDVFGDIPAAIHVTAILTAALILYGVVVICSLYPGYMATRINPAQALHYE
jgi:putative ABC transport system permease protein